MFNTLSDSTCWNGGNKWILNCRHISFNFEDEEIFHQNLKLLSTANLICTNNSTITSTFKHSFIHLLKQKNHQSQSISIYKQDEDHNKFLCS